MAIAVGIGERIAPDCTPKGSSAYRRGLKGLFCTPKALATGIGERIAPDCTPKGSSAYRREQKGLFCTPKELATGIGEQKVAVCTPLGRLRRRRNNSFRSGWRKRERHRELDGELLLIRAARARNVRQTKRRHGPKRAAGSCGPFFYGHRSLHRPTHVPFSPIRSRIVPSPPAPAHHMFATSSECGG
jgi:hypothetical protein